MKAWTDEECLELKAAVWSKHPGAAYENALIRAAVDEARREERECRAAGHYCSDPLRHERGVGERIAAAEARVEALEQNTKLVVDAYLKERDKAVKRVEALVEVLRSAPELPPNEPGDLSWQHTNRQRYREWRKRAAALADEPRKERT